MAETLNGGASLTDFYHVYDNNGTLSVLNKTKAGVASLHTDVAFSLSEYSDSTPEPQDDGTLKISFTNYEDTEALNDFLNEVAVPEDASESITLPDYLREDGISRKGSAASSGGYYVLAINYGPKNAANKRKLHAAIGTIDKTSGGVTQKADDYSKPKFGFTGITAPGALSIAAALFDSRFAAPGAPLSIASGKGFLRTFTTKGSE